MSAINVQLGYQVSDVYRSWELDVDRGSASELRKFSAKSARISARCTIR